MPGVWGCPPNLNYPKIGGYRGLKSVFKNAFDCVANNDLHALCHVIKWRMVDCESKHLMLKE